MLKVQWKSSIHSLRRLPLPVGLRSLEWLRQDSNLHGHRRTRPGVWACQL